MNRRGRLGRMSEEVVSKWLEQKGFEVVDRNVDSCRGEIDIVAEKNDCLYFVEVRSRSGNIDAGRVAESVSMTKRHHLGSAVLQYLAKNNDAEREFKIILATVSWKSSKRCRVTIVPMY